ncbi:uncharacterized protein Hap1MRO34_023629 isoform 2-T2 [Clarias gariepinus]|uniref:uncharacterized protein LOC128509531 isoform X2 n=1 Tax=Clarias gariepinus TaxID=13013 RepID=UPI00234C6E76|nr:uncharacterized protein LOC128509531 isoform X2 [Clarias gariepinus]
MGLMTDSERAVDMKTFTMHMILSSLMVAACVSSVPGFTSTLGTLHQPAVLSCERNCSGLVRWMKIQKRSRNMVVAQCDQTSCSSEHGFSISYHQYLKGNLSLTVTAAEYSRRGWYTCLCDAQDVCDRWQL